MFSVRKHSLTKMEQEVREEVTFLVSTQMGFCVVGTFLNNIAFITLKDLPGLRASTYNVLLCHLTLVNLLVCTVVKPFSAIYVAYAHAIVSTWEYGGNIKILPSSVPVGNYIR